MNEQQLLSNIASMVKQKHVDWREVDATVLTVFANGRTEYKKTVVFKVVKILVKIKFKKYYSAEYLAPLTDDPTLVLVTDSMNFSDVLNKITIDDDGYVVSF